MKSKDFHYIIEELFNTECYDMLDEFTHWQIETIARSIYYHIKMNLERYASCFDANGEEYIIYFTNNSNGSKIIVTRCSELECGKSESMYYIVEPNHSDIYVGDIEVEYDDIKNIVDMLNEAWYNIGQ